MRVRRGDGSWKSLRGVDFLAEGGEAKLYRLGDRVFKVYHEADKSPCLAKVRALSQVHHPVLVPPDGGLWDKQGRQIGVEMAFVEGEPLCRLFSAKGRLDAGLTGADCLRLMEHLADALTTAHQAGVVLVDLNEANVLVHGRNVSIVDLDSAQVGPHLATAQMPTIADPRGAPFDGGTDWFALAVLSFQLFASIHPFRGRIKPRRSLAERMADGCTVYADGVRLPPSATLDAVPPELVPWYRQVFEQGLREAPPLGVAPVVVGLNPPVVGLSLVLHEVAKLAGEPRQFTFRGGRWAAIVEDGIWSDGHRRGKATADMVLGWANGPIGVTRRHLVDVDTQRQVALPQGVGPVVACTDGRVLVKLHDQVCRLNVVDHGTLLPVLLPLAQVLPHATELGPGVALQSLLGATWLSVFPAQGHQQHRVPELDGLKVLRVVAQGQVVVGIVMDQGRLDRFLFRGDPATLQWSRDVPNTDLELAVTATGVVVVADGGGQIELWSSNPQDLRCEVLVDPMAASLRLLGADGGIVAAAGRRLGHLAMGPQCQPASGC